MNILTSFKNSRHGSLRETERLLRVACICTVIEYSLRLFGDAVDGRPLQES